MGTDIRANPKLDVIKEEEIKHLLLPGEVGAILELTVSNKDGKVTEKRVLKSKSFVRQFLELLWVQAFPIPEVVTYSVRDTGNILRAICESGFIFACNAAAADVTLGIIIGTGAVAPTINDYVIGTIIPNATMNYGGVTFGTPASDATTSQFTITRNFANVSGGAVTVNEIALYVKGYKYNTAYYFMTIRDVIAGGIAVPNGQTLTVNYRLQAAI